MTKRELIWTLAGAACFGWGGQSVAAGAATVTMRAINLDIFALGIIMLANFPLARLASRIRALEAKPQT